MTQEQYINTLQNDRVDNALYQRMIEISVRGILVDCNESMAAFEEYAQENFLFGGKTTRKRISTKGEACNCYAFKTGGDD